MLRMFVRYLALNALLSLPLLAVAQPDTRLMTYDLALKAMDASEAYARERGWNVTILVTDQNANPVMLRRMDGASVRSIGFATSKALVVTKTGLTSGEYADRLGRGEIAEIEGGTTYKGGVPVYSSGALIGAVTTSGVEDFHDLEVSVAGAEAIGSIYRNGAD